MLRYITHRPEREGERITRLLFGHDGERSKLDAYQMIDAQKSMTYFHIKLNFHPKREDTRRDLDLGSITTQTIRALEERLQRRIGFIAAEHTDHSPLRHIHAIAMIKLKRGERLTREDFKAMRDIATEQAMLQRKARDLVQQYFRTRQYITRSRAYITPASRPLGMMGDRTKHTQKIQAPTPPCPTSGIGHSTVQLPNGKLYCHTCERVQEQNLELSL
jgi:hypothetical protein